MSALPQAVQSVGIFNGPYYLSIAGNLVKSQDSFDVINPATGEVFAKAPAASGGQLEEAVAAARMRLKPGLRLATTGARNTSTPTPTPTHSKYIGTSGHAC